MKKIILFAAKCFIVCFGTLFFLFILNQRYEQVRDNPYSDADKFFHMKEYPDIQICNLGSSHGENAFKYDQLAYARGYQCFNLPCPARHIIMIMPSFPCTKSNLRIIA